VAGREPTSKGEKSWQAAGYVGAEVMEESRNIGGGGGGLGLVGVHGPARPRGKPRSSVMLVRLPASCLFIVYLIIYFLFFIYLLFLFIIYLFNALFIFIQCLIFYF
jgi:hypothetical protein